MPNWEDWWVTLRVGHAMCCHNGAVRRSAPYVRYWNSFPTVHNTLSCFFVVLFSKETDSVLETLIAKRTNYLEDCNKTLSKLPETGEPPTKKSIVSPVVKFFWHELFSRQESTVKEDSICFFVGHIHLLGMCQCPAHPTYPGSMRVT